MARSGKLQGSMITALLFWQRPRAALPAAAPLLPAAAATMVGLNFGYSGRRLRETKLVVTDRNMVPSAIPSIEGLAAMLTKMSPTLLDDGVETSSKPMTRRNTRAGGAGKRKKHWRKMRTRLGAEGPLELVHRRLRDPKCRAIMRFRWAQHMTEGSEAHLLGAHDRTRYMQMQAHAMSSMMEDAKPKPGKLKEKAVLRSEDFRAVMRFLWRSGALAKTRTGLLCRYAYERFNYLLHYALLPNLLHADEAFQSAKADWERDLARSANEWPVDPEDLGGDDSVEGDPPLRHLADPVGAVLAGLDASAEGGGGASGDDDESAPDSDDSYFDELQSEPDLQSDHLVEDEPGVDFEALTRSMFELVDAWTDGFTTAEYASILFALVEATIGPSDLFNVTAERDARRALSEFALPGASPRGIRPPGLFGYPFECFKGRSPLVASDSFPSAVSSGPSGSSS